MNRRETILKGLSITLSGEGDKNKIKAANGLMNPDKLYMETISKGGLKNPKNDIIERDNTKVITNDGRELLNEKK